MRICIDIDGTICPLRQPSQSYTELKPFPGVVEKIKSLRESGCYIILCTARHMKTCQSNIGQVIAKQGHNLTEWLKKHGIEYEELWFGKPYADVYIDDKAYHFKGNWNDITAEMLKEAYPDTLGTSKA